LLALLLGTVQHNRFQVFWELHFTVICSEVIKAVAPHLSFPTDRVIEHEKMMRAYAFMWWSFCQALLSELSNAPVTFEEPSVSGDLVRVRTFGVRDVFQQFLGSPNEP